MESVNPPYMTRESLSQSQSPSIKEMSDVKRAFRYLGQI